MIPPTKLVFSTVGTKVQRSLRSWDYLVGKVHRELSTSQNWSLNCMNFLPETKLLWYSGCDLPGPPMGRKSSVMLALVRLCPFEFLQKIQDQIFLWIWKQVIALSREDTSCASEALCIDVQMAGLGVRVGPDWLHLTKRPCLGTYLSAFLATLSANAVPQSKNSLSSSWWLLKLHGPDQQIIVMCRPNPALGGTDFCAATCKLMVHKGHSAIDEVP